MISLFVFLPVGLLFLAALGILILMQIRPSIGYAWLIGALAGLLTVGAVIYLRWRLPLQFSIDQWRPLASLSNSPTFRLDTLSWPYVFCLVVLALAFILTDAARLDTEARPLNWALGLGLAGLGLLAVMAGNPFTLIMTWTMVDLVEFLMVISTRAGRRMGVQTVTTFSVRVMGTLLVLLAILIARSQAIEFTLAPIPQPVGLLMLLAAGLRLGVLPLNLPYTREVYLWRGLGNVMRMIGPASSLMVLGRMPEQAVPEQWKGVFLVLSGLAALYGAVMWLTADHELNGRSYWSIALAALAIASVINGNPRASIAWGTVLLLVGSVLFLYSARRRQILFIPFLGLLGIIGLPYNPAAPGWIGLAGGSFNLFTLLFVLTGVFLVWGYLRHILRPRDELYRMERWVHTVFPVGLMALVLGQWVVGILGGSGSFTVGIWWAPVLVTFLAGLGVVGAFSLRGLFAEAPASETSEGLPDLNPTQKTIAATWRWVRVFALRVGGVLGSIFALNWLYRIIVWAYQRIQSVVHLLTAMFEGDGGILWTLVMLALLISMIWAGGGQ